MFFIWLHVRVGGGRICGALGSLEKYLAGFVGSWKCLGKDGLGIIIPPANRRCMHNFIQQNNIEMFPR